MEDGSHENMRRKDLPKGWSEKIFDPPKINTKTISSL